MQLTKHDENPIQRVERTMSNFLTTYNTIKEPTVRGDAKVSDWKALVERLKEAEAIVAQSVYQDNKQELEKQQLILGQKASELEKKVSNEDEYVRGASDLIKTTAYTIGVAAKMKACKSGNLGDYEIDQERILKYLAENKDGTLPKYLGGGKDE